MYLPLTARLYRIYFVLLFPAILAGHAPLSAQAMRHWSESELLSNRYANHMIQDHQGFLWIATDNGLNRFDGYNFWVINSINYKELVSNRINCLLEDEKHQLWIGTDDGLHVLDLETYRMQAVYRNTAAAGSLSANKIVDLKADRNHTIWVSTADGVINQHLGKGTFRRIRNPKGTFGLRTHLLPYGDFIYTMSEDFGGFKLDKKTGNVVAEYGQHLVPHLNIPALLPGGGLLLSAKEGAMKYTDQDGIVPVYPDAGKDIFQYHIDFKGDEWFVRNDRRELLQRSEGTWRNRTAELYKTEENVHIRFLFEDNSHNIWLCTTSGIYKLSNEKPVFTHILRSDQFVKDRYIPSFRGMMEDAAGTVFIGGYPGLFRYDAGGTLRQLFDNTIPYTPYTLIDKNKDELWAICEGHGLMRVNKTTGAVQEYIRPGNEKMAHPGLYLTTGILANDGDFWLSGYDGLLRFNPRTEQYYDVPLFSGDKQFSNFVIKHIYQRPGNDTWFCCEKGAFVLKPDGKTVEHYFTGGKGKYRLPFDDIKCLYEDAYGVMWLGTSQHGVIALDADTFRLYTTQNGLADNSIASLTGTPRGDLWIATNNGLSLLKKGSSTFVNYFEEDGLADNEFNHNSYLAGKNGMLYFGGINGISMLGLQKEGSLPEGAARLVLSRFETAAPDGSMKTDYGSAALQGGLILPFERSDLYLEFFTTDFLRPEKNTFEYQLEGLSNNWVSLGNQHSLRFPAIPPGDYVLKIRSTNSRGNRIPQQLEIPITVKQIFYRTVWFIVLVIVIVFALVLFYMRLRQKRERALAEMRIRIASNLHDDIGSVLTRIAMQAEILEEEAAPGQKTMLGSIVKSARGAMASMRDVVWTIDARKSNVGGLFEKLIDHTHQQFGNSAIACKIDFDESLNQVVLLPVQKQEIFLIFKEALHNAQKYAAGNTIRITARNAQQVLELQIENETAGEKEFVSAGSGLMNMKLRASRIGASLEYIHKDKKFALYLKVPLHLRKWKFRKKKK